MATAGTGVDTSAGGAIAITKSDTTQYNGLRGVYVGGTGDVTLGMFDGTTVTFSAVPVGVIIPVKAQRVMSTGTTATLLTGLF